MRFGKIMISLMLLISCDSSQSMKDYYTTSNSCWCFTPSVVGVFTNNILLSNYQKLVKIDSKFPNESFVGENTNSEAF